MAHEINNPIGFVFSNIGTLEGYLSSLFTVLDVYEVAESTLADPAMLAGMKALRQKVNLAFLKEDIPLLMGESRGHLAGQKDCAGFDFHGSIARRAIGQPHRGLIRRPISWPTKFATRRMWSRNTAICPRLECLPSQLNQVFAGQFGACDGRGAWANHDWLRRCGRYGLAGDSDTGSGIPEEIGQKIFDPFFTDQASG